MSSYRCDNSDSNLSSGSVNVTNNFIVNTKTNIKAGIDSSNSNNNQATFTSEDIQNSHQIPLVRLPSNTLLKYTAYKDVSIQHFLMPMDSRSAMFSFKAYEESKSALTRVCQPQDVTLHLKAGSYPVISPENITFPKHFLSAQQRFEIFTLQFKSDGVTRRMTVDGPHPGNWFGVAFISWTDPNNERIEQQGLSPSCETLLLSEMTVTRASLKILNSDVDFVDFLSTNMTVGNSYKFFVPRNVDICSFKLTIKKLCERCEKINFAVQAHSLPTSKNYLNSKDINANETSETVIEFYPHENAWHYVDLKFAEPKEPSMKFNASTSSSRTQTLNNSAVQSVAYSAMLEFRYNHISEQTEDETVKIEVTDKDEDNSDDFVKYVPSKTRNFEEYPLLRQTYREFFMYDYDLVPDINGTVPISINLTAGIPALMKFHIGDVYDIGGTLSFAIAMRHDISGGLIDSMPVTSTTLDMNGEGAIAEKLVAEETKQANQTVVICLHLNEPGLPTWPDRCIYGRQNFPANSVINNTDAETGTGVIHVPFPETGTWYVTIGLFCHNDNLATQTAGTTIIDSVKTFIRHNAQTLTSFKPPCSCAVGMNTTIQKDCLLNDVCLNALRDSDIFKIKECLMDVKCTGVEHTKFSRAFDTHYKWVTEHSISGKTLGCVDGSCNSSVVFTLASNPCVTGRCGRNGRCYHYMSGGFISVLQFCDFYCGLLAIWVTLIAMANVRQTFVSLLHMFGAILLAFGTELNKQSLWVFLAPALTGICIISVSWGMKCRKKKQLYPSKKYLALNLPLGSVLVMIGLVCYAFLQTKQNYHIVHSIWHMVMALSILCLLPKRKVFETKC
ncbi:CLUMA_CG002537, isoform A [Clunio marinus]|uniref:CLUMA_CG002537, isoform A n=1 Tax=Clunio marinus TaxID=568069 RepID=A0A1J1HRW6_9DIPT|nr:CLUMA_CG002537, isoform A [Clunio marinus]